MGTSLTMDWVGIKRAERIMQILLILCGIGSIIYAYLFEWFPYCTFGMIGGFGVASLISAPDWPWFNQNPVGWYRAIDVEKEEAYFKKKQKKNEKKNKKDKKEKKKSPKNKKSKKDN